MAITRFDRFTPRDYNMEWFTPKEIMPNFELWGEMLAKQQNDFDLYNASLSNKNPKYLQTDEDRNVFNQYRQLADSAITNVTDAYTNQGVTAGNRYLKQYAAAINKEWQPGGKAAILEDRYNSYAAAQQEIEKTFKDDTNPANKWYAYKQLKDQLKNPLNYNSDTGEYTRIQTPELYKDANIIKAINEAVKNIQESGDTNIVRLSPYWLQKIKTEGRTKESLEAVTAALLQQPEFAKQRDIESLYKFNGVDPNKAKSEYESELRTQYKNIETQLKDDSKAESILANQGYDVSTKDKLKQAKKDFLKKQNDEISNEINNFDFENYSKAMVNKSYLNYAKSFANQKRDVDLIYDKSQEWKEKAALERTKINTIISEMQKMRETPKGTVLATPFDGKVMDQYNKLRDKSFQDANVAKSKLETILQTKDATGKSLVDRFGGDPNAVAFYLNAYEVSGGNPEKFAGIVNSNRQFSGKTDNQVNDLFNTLTSSAPALKQAYTAFQSAKNLKENFEKSDVSTIENYTSTPEGKKKFESLKLNYKRPDESDEDFMKAVVNKDPRFNITAAVPFTFGTSKQTTGNAADDFLESRNKFMKANPKDFANSINTYSIIGSNDSNVGAFGKLLVQDIENKNFIGYTSEGKQGLTWRNSTDNSEVDVSKMDLQNVNWEMTTLGENGAGYVFTATARDGKGGTKPVIAYVDNIPTTHVDAARNALIAAKANTKNTKDTKGEQAITQALSFLDGYDYTKAAAQNAITVTSKNSETHNLIFPAMNSSGKLIPGGSVQNVKGIHLEDIETNAGTYGKYKVTNNLGQQQYIMTWKRFGANGDLISEAVVPNNNGGYYYNNAQDIDFNIKSKQYDTQIPVESNVQKLPAAPNDPNVLNFLMNQ